MPTDTQPLPASNALFWTGSILTGLLVLFLVFDGATKVMKVKPVVEACEKVGIAESMVMGIGLLLLACTTIYAIPRTAVLGAVLLTGYLGGAIVVHLRAGSGWFPTLFAFAFGLFAWAGLVLREPRLFWLILLRQ